MDIVPQIEISARITSSERHYYKVIQRLGAGGNAHVYLVQATSGPFRGVPFALKLFVKIKDVTRLQRFRQEVGFLKACSHPSIMRVYDDGIYSQYEGSETSEFPFVIADYLPKTLRHAMREGLSTADKLTFILQLLSALSYLSSREKPIVHRDIKPENIFVRGKSCVLGDFGLMKILGEEPSHDSEFVMESVGPRLPRYYRSPDLVEYCKNRIELTAKSDVFQLGLVAAEMFFGVNPLAEAKHIYEPVKVEPFTPTGGSHASVIANEVSRMLEEDPNRRPIAHDLADKWEGIYFEVIKMCHQLEGKVY